jgi:hypothetical protein
VIQYRCGRALWLRAQREHVPRGSTEHTRLKPAKPLSGTFAQEYERLSFNGRQNSREVVGSQDWTLRCCGAFQCSRKVFTASCSQPPDEFLKVLEIDNGRKHRVSVCPIELSRWDASVAASLVPVTSSHIRVIGCPRVRLEPPERVVSHLEKAANTPSPLQPEARRSRFGGRPTQSGSRPSSCSVVRDRCGRRAVRIATVVEWGNGRMGDGLGQARTCSDFSA